MAIGAGAWAQTQSPTIEALIVKRNPTCVGGTDNGVPCIRNCDCDLRLCGGFMAPVNDIVLNPGDVIVTEFFASEWSHNGEKLRAFQINVDLAELATGDRGAIRVVERDRCCDSTIDCTDVSPTATCIAGACTEGPLDPPFPPEAAGTFIDAGRTDYIFPFVTQLRAVDLSSFDEFVRYVAVVFKTSQTLTYVPPRRYIATLALAVSADASGAFRIRLIPLGESGVSGSGLFDSQSPSQPILPIALLPATITVVPAVCGNGFCETGEDDVSCPVDCLVTVCGNGICEEWHCRLQPL